MKLVTSDGLVELTGQQVQSSPLLTDVLRDPADAEVAVPFDSRAVYAWIDSLAMQGQQSRHIPNDSAELAFGAIKVRSEVTSDV